MKTTKITWRSWLISNRLTVTTREPVDADSIDALNGKSAARRETMLRIHGE